MVRGGYTIIDLKNKNFKDSVGMVIDGIYDRIESTRKPIRLCNVVIDDKELRDVDVVFLGVSGSTYTATMIIGTTDYSLTISDLDVVTFTGAT